MTFHETFRLPTHPALVRDIAWSPFNVRGLERIATACKDGAIRIFELDILPSTSTNSNGDSKAPAPTSRGIRSRPPQQSSLTSAITGKSNTATPTNAGRQTRAHAFPWTYQVQHVSTVPAHGDAWSVSWDAQGQVLMSGGSDGVTKLWRKSVQGGKWLLFADQSVDVDGGADGEDES
ncbi:MAG: epoxide hydrolase, soluble (sEH) [Watsoniomyces obsoletus]|nr:MAG: epoxide hydrolase, soluble (sEH) [Watsoniomyces obsoletus]